MAGKAIWEKSRNVCWLLNGLDWCRDWGSYRWNGRLGPRGALRVKNERVHLFEDRLLLRRRQAAQYLGALVRRNILDAAAELLFGSAVLLAVLPLGRLFDALVGRLNSRQ